MKTLVVYRTHHGTTEYVAKIIKERLNGHVETVDLKVNPYPPLEEFSTIIVGGSIHAGQIQGSIKKFCAKNEEVLKSKKLGLFLCYMEEGEIAEKQFNEAFPEGLREKSSSKGLLGGQFLIEKMNFFEKMIVKKVARIEKSISKVHEPAIEKFVAELNA